MTEAKAGYQYWAVQCEECDKLIPLRRYRGFVLTWPQQFEAQCECKFIGTFYRTEIGYATFPDLIPREQLPKIEAVESAPLSIDEVSGVAKFHDKTT
jgi:hypothetical protein